MRQSGFLRIFILVVSLCIPTQSSGQPSRLDLYGFFDFEVEATNSNGGSIPWTFDQHHLNLVTIYRVESRAAVFTEIEWEHGPSIEAGSGEGKIYLARAYLEYTHTDALRLRIGKFLTPFGLYNERHDATPTFITTKLPQAIYGRHSHGDGPETRHFSKTMVGLELVGTVTVDRWEATYRGFVGNGRGPTQSGSDNNSNKAVGGRLIISPPVGEWHVGMSFYRDRNGSANDQKQWVLGLESELDYEALHLESEIVFPRMEMVDGMSAMSAGTHKSLGYYGLAAVTLRDRVTVFGRHSAYDPDTGTASDILRVFTFGANYALSTRIVLKNEVHWHRFEHPGDEDFEMLVTSVAVAF